MATLSSSPMSRLSTSGAVTGCGREWGDLGHLGLQLLREVRDDRVHVAAHHGPGVLLDVLACPGLVHVPSVSMGRFLCSRAMSYTIKNLRDAEDSAAKHGFSETQEARFLREDL